MPDKQVCEFCGQPQRNLIAHQGFDPCIQLTVYLRRRWDEARDKYYAQIKRSA